MVTKIFHFEGKSYFSTLLVDSGRSASASLVSKNIHFFSHVFKKRLFSIFCISLWDLDKLLENNSKFTIFFHKKSEYFLKPDSFEICPPLLRLRQLTLDKCLHVHSEHFPKQEFSKIVITYCLTITHLMIACINID